MVVAYDDPITFGRDGSAAGMSCRGIDFNDDGDRSWTTAPLAEIDIRLPLARNDISMEVLAAPFHVTTMVPRQQVFAYLGGAFLGFWTITEYGKHVARIDRVLLSGRPTRVSFAIPTAQSPCALGLSEDERVLGLHLHQLVFRTDR